MAATWKDITIPYTDIEIEEIRSAFRSNSTYTPENGGSVAVSEIDTILQAMKMERNPEQVKIYTFAWNTFFNGRIHEEIVVDFVKNVHNNASCLKTIVQSFDKNGDGFISKDEFAYICKMIPIHDPKLSSFDISFDDFVKQADTNLDGRVSVEECTAWFGEKMQMK